MTEESLWPARPRRLAGVWCAVLWAVFALELCPGRACALSAHDFAYFVAVNPNQRGWAPEQVWRIHSGGRRGLIERRSIESLAVGHLRELENTLFIVAEGPGDVIGAFLVRLETDRFALFVDAGAPLDGQLLGEWQSRFSTIAARLEPAELLGAHLVDPADSLEAPGRLDEDLAERALGLGTRIAPTPLGEFLIPRFE